MITLEGDYNLFNSFKNQIIYFKDVDWNEENPICQQFKRIKNLKIKSDDAPQIKLNLLNKSTLMKLIILLLLVMMLAILKAKLQIFISSI